MSILFDAVKSLYEIFDKKAAKREANIDAASIAFREAMTETRIYLAAGKRTGTRDYEKEATLARLWSKAATDARKHAAELSDKCLEISRYWAESPQDPLRHADETLALIGQIFESAREDEELEE